MGPFRQWAQRERLESRVFRSRTPQGMPAGGGEGKQRPMSTRSESSQDPYDRIAPAYTATRRGDPRIARQIHEALGDARSVVNVGAGAGAYEPRDRNVIPVEPSERMIAQRSPELARAVRAYAESLPLETDSVDAAMTCLSLHHWSDWLVGVQEMRRVARKRIVIFTYDPAYAERFWLLRDYLPDLGQLDSRRFPTLAEQCAAAGEYARVSSVPIPHDCHDGFMAAFWRRPHAYLDARVRSNMSSFHLPGAERLLGGLRQLAEDLHTGRWHECNRHLLECEELDLGYRLIVADMWAKQALAAEAQAS
jgi:SAM-dependent methyltransferase